MVDTVKFRRCPLFNETFEKHKNTISTKFQEFVQTKAADPMARFGAKDTHFTGGSALGQAGLIHAHLTQDVSIIYKRHGKNPTIIDLVAVASHSESGTGNSPNNKLQKVLAKKADQQVFEKR